MIETIMTWGGRWVPRILLFPVALVIVILWCVAWLLLPVSIFDKYFE